MKKFFRDNGLTVVLLVIFLLALTGQTLAGYRVHNEERAAHSLPSATLAAYLSSGDYGEAVFENWESEFLQMAAYVVLTAILFQRGSAESRDPDAPESNESKETGRAGPRNEVLATIRAPWLCSLYGHSLSLTLGGLFFLSFWGHAVMGARAYSEEQLLEGKEAVGTLEYLQTAQFWFESLQNWQSEFLAVAVLVVFTIWLREKDSPESKGLDDPVGKTGK